MAAEAEGLFTPEYRLCSRLLDAALAKWLEVGNPPPRFAFPPDEIGLIADLRAIDDKIVRNDAAEIFVRICHAIGDKVERETGRPGRPTAIMLRAALRFHRVEVETVSLSHFGIEIGQA